MVFLKVGKGKKGKSKEPVAGLLVKVFDRSKGSCVREFGTSKRHFKSIWFSCISNGDGFTDGSGSVSIEVAPGEYLVIGEFDPDGISQSGDEVYIGGKVKKLKTGKSKRKKLKVKVK